jgi:predicted nucleic acid-binding Zn ribbon protein
MRFQSPDEPKAVPLGDVLRKLMKRMRRMDRGKFSGLQRAWSEMVGEQISERTRVAGFRDGQLTIEVDSPVLMHELTSFMKQNLLTGMQQTEKGADVARIRFRLGPVNKDS